MSTKVTLLALVGGIVMGLILSLLLPSMAGCPEPEPCVEKKTALACPQCACKCEPCNTITTGRSCPPCNGSTTDSSSIKGLLSTPSGDWRGLFRPVFKVDENGNIPLREGVKRIALDIGASLYSPSSYRWWQTHPNDLGVLAFEPNPFAHSLLAYTAHPVMANNPNAFLFHNLKCRRYYGNKTKPTPMEWYKYCVNTSHGHITAHNEDFIPFQAACSNVDGYSTFNLGIDDSGVGSLYEFKKESKWGKKKTWGHTVVTKLRIDSVLNLLPKKDYVFEVAKIDAQGHDAEVVAGFGEWLPRFKCLIGEFDVKAALKAYEGAEDKEVDHREILKGAGFKHVELGLWVNTLFKQHFLDANYMCTAWDLKVDHWRILSTLGVPKKDWTKGPDGRV